jgi:hypothetical protein
MFPSDGRGPPVQPRPFPDFMPMKNLRHRICPFRTAVLPLLLISCPPPAGGGSVQLVETRCFPVPEARQGIAVDENFFYAIDSRQIAKYEKDSGRLVKKWVEEGDGPIIHLDSGVVIEGKIICAHSNYPGVPMTSSIETWDAETMEHMASHSFGIRWGSCTWVDYHDGHWWAAFGHYDKLKDLNYTDNKHSTLVKFDERWRMVEAWVYPEEILKRFHGMANSGGSWGSDGRLYLTGHDLGELYVIRFPKAGSVLELEEIIPAAIEGQGIAWDRSEKGVLLGIRRKCREVVRLQIVED